jgi:hypothetical protein
MVKREPDYHVERADAAAAWRRQIRTAGRAISWITSSQREHRDGRLVGDAQTFGRWVRGSSAKIAHPVGSHWPGDVLDMLFAQVLKHELEPVAHLITHDPADADPTRVGQGFEPCRDIEPVPEDVLALGNHVAQVDPDAELDPLLRRGGPVAIGHPALHLHGAPDGIDHTCKLGQEAVARVLYDPAPMLGDLRLD